jgi:hypothetical protein
MSTENVGKKRGRPEKPEKSISVHCRVRPELYRLLVDRAEKDNLIKDGKPNVSRVLMNEAAKSLCNS